MTKHIYRLKYNIQSGKFTKEVLQREETAGGCDAFIIHSIIYPENGSRSEKITAVDGRTGKKLDDEEIFKSWIGMARMLSLSETLQPGKKELCQIVWEEIRETVIRATKEREH